MNSDSPIVDEVRCRRMAISAQVDHDLEKYLAHLRAIEQECRDRVVNQVTVVGSAKAAQPAK